MDSSACSELFWKGPIIIQFRSVQSLSRVRLFMTPWTAAHQASLFITNSRSPPKPMSIESVMSSNHLILCYPLLLLPSVFPSIRIFSNESVPHISDQSIGSSASASVLSMNIQCWLSLILTGLISLQSRGLLSLFQHLKFESINSSVFHLLHRPTLTFVHDY